jgi:hypothetical protein
MQSVGRAASRERSVVVAALIALAADLAPPLLPIYGDGHRFVWEGFPGRFTAAYFIGTWATALVVSIGIVLVRRRPELAAGMFAAVAVVVGATIVSQLLQGPVVRWQTDLVLALEAIEVIALAIATAVRRT